jgi:hypothetical protein
MKMNELLLIVALIAVVVALFAWAVAKLQNASKPARRPVIGNINRKFFRAHMRKIWLAPLLIERVLHAMGFTRAPAGNVMFANTGDGTFEGGVRTYTADADTTGRYLIYKVGSDNDHSAIAGLNDVAIGVSNDQAQAGQPIAIQLFGCKPGMLRVQTDGTINNLDYMKAGAAGQATKATTGDAGIFGRAVFGTDTTNAANDVITFVHDVPSKVSF